MKKIFTLTEEDLKNIETIKRKYGLKTDVAAVRYALTDCAKNMEVGNQEVQIVEEVANLLTTEKIIQSSVRAVEKNTNVLLDVVNTILFNNKIDVCVPRDAIKSPVISTAEEKYKDNIAHKKQKKDYRVNK